jgi:hypothetical protein
MRTYLFLFILGVFLMACTQNSGTRRIDNSSENKIRNQVINVAENYAINQLKDTKKTVAKDGIITLGDNQKSYVIDPAKIFIGLIDDDSNKDAIVSIDYYNGQYLVLTEHLILIKTDSKFMLIRAIESDMKILRIKDRVITAEISTRSRNSPLRDCLACKEIVNYQFRGGDLIRMQ